MNAINLIVLSASFTLAFAVNASATPIATSADCWDIDPFSWRVEPSALHALGSRTFTMSLKEPVSDAVTFSADITPVCADGTNWCVLGISVGTDEQNFWHLACVRTPMASGGHRVFELAEMTDGHWPAQDRDTRPAPVRRIAGSWNFGETYRFTLTMNPKGVSGEVRDHAGTVVFRSERLFTDRPAARKGAPSLHVYGDFAGRFANFESTHGAVIARERVTFPPYDSKSFEPSIRSKATGFFRVEKASDGSWWAIDPLGRGTIIFGVDHIRYDGHGSTRTTRRRYREHNDATYPNRKAWDDETLSRLKTWGFNMLGAGHDLSLRHRGLVHTDFLSIGQRLCDPSRSAWYICPNEGRPCSALPNMFHPDFPAWCDSVARHRCAPQKDDPWLFGYFFDNEFAWWGRGNRQTGLWDSVLALPAEHSARRALDAFAAKRGIDPKKASTADKTDFVRLAAERYFKTVADAIRRHDPNHLLLGARFAGLKGAPDVVWEVAGKYCDIVTFNCYPWADLDTGIVKAHSSARGLTLAEAYGELFARTGRPMMVTEWSFPALDSGLPCTNGAGQRFRTQKERTKATELFVRSFLALPYMVGYDYFMWVDEPPEGISDAFPEDTNYGLVSEAGKPYPLVEAFSRLQCHALATRREGTPKPKVPLKSVATRWKGAVIPEWKVGGKTVGSYDVMLSFEMNESRAWFNAAHVRNCVKTSVNGCEHWTLVSEWNNGRKGAAFEIVHEIQFSATGDSFVARLLAVRNTGSVPFVAPTFYFRTYAPYAGEEDEGYSDGQNTWSKRKRVPNMWKAPSEDRWLARDGRYIGARTMSAASSTFRYYFNRKLRSQHPDACFALGDVEVLAPGATYVSTGDIWVEVLGGTDGEDGWTRRTKISHCVSARDAGTSKLEGPYPLLVTPWTESAALDIATLVKEAEYVDGSGVGGIIWPTAGEVAGLDADGEYERGLSALAERAADKTRPFSARLTAICPGKNSSEAIARVAKVEAIARRTGAKMAILARPPDNATNQTMIAAHYRALAKATTLPVIIQTYNGKSPQPDVSLIVELAKENPKVFGWVKEESPGDKVNDRMEQLLAHPEIHGVFSGWGAKGFIYQGARIGTCGCITQRPAYGWLFAKVWSRLKLGKDASDPQLAEAYSKYLYMINLGDVFSKAGDDDMRGPHLYVLQRLGIFKNRLTRSGKPGAWKVKNYEMSEKMKAEVESRMKYVFGK